MAEALQDTGRPVLDYHNPDYTEIFRWRAERLAAIRASPELLRACEVWYRDHPWDFITDWGMTFDPRNLEIGRLADVPFILWPKQVEYLQWLEARWRAGENGLVEKSRDCGVTWLSVGWAVCKWRFLPSFVVGFGSRKAELVDKTGDPKSIFFMLRYFVDSLPQEFRPKGYIERVHAANMRLTNPDNGAAIIGEGGDQIGRGGRTSVYFIDESAFVEHQDLVDAALSSTTNCQIDISTVNGPGNAFFRKRQRYGKDHRLFVFDWRDDPRKDDQWYAKKCEELDPVIVAQEIDRDYNAAVPDAFIPAAWVAASIDAHKRLGFDASGIRVTGFDPADVGDAKATVTRWGSVVVQAEALKDGDITYAIPWAWEVADKFRADILGYDGDGMGVPTMRLALQHRAAGRLRIEAYHGSGAVVDPDEKYGHTEGPDEDLKTNSETFRNYRAQSASWLRDRFKATYDAVERVKAGHVANFDPERLISISTSCKDWQKLQTELSMPKRVWTPNGRIMVEEKHKMKARGVESPNLFDALVIAMSFQAPKPRELRRPRKPARRLRDPGTGY